MSKALFAGFLVAAISYGVPTDVSVYPCLPCLSGLSFQELSLFYSSYAWARYSVLLTVQGRVSIEVPRSTVHVRDDIHRGEPQLAIHFLYR